MATAPEGFDLTDPEIQQAPHAYYAAMRSDGVQYLPANDAWVVLAHEDALTVLRDPLTYSSQLGSNRERPSAAAQAEIARIGAEGLARPRTLLDNDPPDHTRYRRLVSRAFTPRKMALLRPFIESVTDELIDAWDTPSSVELVPQFSVPLPVQVITRVLDLPAEHHADFRRWTDARTATIGGSVSDEQHVENARIGVELQQFFVEQFELRRTDPRDDLLTELLNSHVSAGDDGADTEPLGLPELVRIAEQLLVAGNETTAKLITEMMRLIAVTDGEWDRIKADPARIPRVVEESLRISSPNQGMSRIVMHDTTLAGVEIPAGARVVVMFASANRDEALFGCPNDLQPDRDHVREQVAFGHGTHFCVGAGLALQETTIALERFAARVASYRLHEDNTFEYLPSVTLRGLKRLHLDVVMEPDLT